MPSRRLELSPLSACWMASARVLFLGFSMTRSLLPMTRMTKDTWSAPLSVSREQTWSTWIQRNAEVLAMVFGGSFSPTQSLRHANLQWVSFAEGVFSGTDASYADFSHSELIEANFIRAKLVDAKLSPVNASDMDLAFADASGADFSHSLLWESDFAEIYSDRHDI